MKKKGFTLVELIGVIVLLGAVLLIIIPVVNKSLKEGKQKTYDSQIEGIKQALVTWSTDNKPNKNETFYLTLSQLKQAGLVENNLKNPTNDEYLANDMVLKVINQNGVLNYEVLDETGTCKNDYNLTPKIYNPNNIEYVEINTTYNDVIATAKDKDGNLLNNITTTGVVDTSKLGSYYITYNVSNNGSCNSSIKTIIVIDTKGPVISFNSDLEISSNEVNTYNFLSDVTVTDNSNLASEITVEKNFSALKGTYSIKYIATDASGNTTTKLRKVTVK